MIAIQSSHLPRDLMGAEAPAKLHQNRTVALGKALSISVGAIAIVLTAACQQFDSKASVTSSVQPAAVVLPDTQAHDNNWISQAHAVAAKTGVDVEIKDLSY